MPTLNATFHKRSRSFDARPDRLDLRDRIYQPRLINLPAACPSPVLMKQILPIYAGLVLDQKSEGSCTGFGLAAMINYLHFREGYHQTTQKRKFSLPSKVSPRMLYDNARLYDEWEGEDYEGSSCRGALKGWQHHGVCTEATWPYLTAGNPGKPKSKWREEAGGNTLGAYYRIEIDDITALQSAIHEVGAVYVSADVHEGWELPPKPDALSLISWAPGMDNTGGHAFALVGYTETGFILQNSWGPTWGFHGFAVISYQDWLANASDAWIAALGVPRTGVKVPAYFSSEPFRNVAALGPNVAAVSSGNAGTESQPALWNEQQVNEHALVIGNEGVLLRKAVDKLPGEYVNESLINNIKDWMAKSDSNTRIAIYVHGGLNSENDGFKRARHMGPYFKENGIFPIFVIWKTGWVESFLDTGTDIAARVLPKTLEADEASSSGAWEKVKEKLSDVLDRTVEGSLGPLGRALWGQMKQNAAAAGKKEHGCQILAKALRGLMREMPTAQVHLIGHSAGSIWLGNFLTTLREISDEKLRIESCHLFAAACTVAFANQHYIPAVEGKTLAAADFHFHNLADDAERADTVKAIYRKSLLYFISRACEEHKTPLLGMEATWNANLERENDIFNEQFKDDLAEWRDFVRAYKVPAPQFIPVNYTVNTGGKPQSPSHGGFDNDIKIIGDALSDILGKALPYPVTNLVDL